MEKRRIYPFKFNTKWLQMEAFKNLVYRCWNGVQNSATQDGMALFCQKLNMLKREARTWIKEIKEAIVEDLSEIEEKLRFYNDPGDPLYFSVRYKER